MHCIRLSYRDPHLDHINQPRFHLTADIINIYERRLHALYKISKDVCHNLWRAQTALIHYTRGPAEWLTLKPDTGMLTHLPLGDSGTRLQDTLCPGHRWFEDSLLISWAWVSQRHPWVLLLTERRTRVTLNIPRRQVHITSIPAHQHTCNVKESTPELETQICQLTFLFEIAARWRPVSLPAQDIDVSTNTRLVSWAWGDQRHSWAPFLNDWHARATMDSTRSQVHITLIPARRHTWIPRTNASQPT